MILFLFFRFSTLPMQLVEEGILPHSFDGIIIDTGCNYFQVKDKQRGFCPASRGKLDLRMDGKNSNTEQPTASEVLQYIDERSLHRILKVYGELGNWAKYVVSSIIEARYMFHQFQTTQVGIYLIRQHHGFGIKMLNISYEIHIPIVF